MQTVVGATLNVAQLMISPDCQRKLTTHRTRSNLKISFC